MSNSIIDKAADALEAEIVQAQTLLTQMRAHSGRSAVAPATKTSVKKVHPKTKGTGPKKWTPEHRANFIKAMAKLKKDRKKAPATSAAQ